MLPFSLERPEKVRGEPSEHLKVIFQLISSVCMAKGIVWYCKRDGGMVWYGKMFGNVWHCMAKGIHVNYICNI